jgi:iron complex transport system substrate-binding protein
LLAWVLALAVLTTACGDDDAATTTQAPITTAAPTTTTLAEPTTVAPATSEAPTTTEAPAFPREVLGVTIPARPVRIVSASATHTEILYALGAGDRIVAVDMFSNHPAAALGKEIIDAFNINVESVAAFDPDLVILSYDPGDVAAGLATLGIPTVLFPTAPTTLEDAYAEMMVVGAVIGADEEAAGLVQGIRDGIDEIVSNIEVGEGDAPTYYHELGPDLYSVTSSTFIGTLYALLGMQNIADPADDAGFGFPQLSMEYILTEDPDFIFLADTVCCGQTAETLVERPGWETLSAIRGGRVVELDDDLASRWGPRIVEFIETVAAAVYAPAG